MIRVVHAELLMMTVRRDRLLLISGLAAVRGARHGQRTPFLIVD